MTTKQMTKEQLKIALEKLKRKGLTIGQCIQAFGDTETSSVYVSAAKAQHDEGTLEIDDTSIVSESGESANTPGAYVSAWLWVSEEEAYEKAKMSTILKIAAKGALQYISGKKASKNLPNCDRIHWLISQLTERPELFDDIENAKLTGVPAPISIVGKSGLKQSLMPSDAYQALRQAAIHVNSSAALFNRIDEFFIRFGNKLDAILAAAQRNQQSI